METGRKRASKRQVSVRLSHETIAFLNSEAELSSTSRSGVIRDLLDFCADPMAFVRRMGTPDEEFERWCEQQEKTQESHLPES